MAAKRKTTRQIAASRRNIKKAQIISARKRSRKATVLKGLAVGAVLAGAAVTARKAYNNQFVTLYHNTRHHKARMIVKNGFDATKGHNYGDGRMYFHVGQNPHWYGPTSVELRVRKSTLKSKAFRFDHKEFEAMDVPAVSIDGRVLKRSGMKMKLGMVRQTKRIIRTGDFWLGSP